MTPSSAEIHTTGSGAFAFLLWSAMGSGAVYDR